MSSEEPTPSTSNEQSIVVNDDEPMEVNDPVVPRPDGDDPVEPQASVQLIEARQDSDDPMEFQQLIDDPIAFRQDTDNPAEPQQLIDDPIAFRQDTDNPTEPQQISVDPIELRQDSDIPMEFHQISDDSMEPRQYDNDPMEPRQYSDEEELFIVNRSHQLPCPSRADDRDSSSLSSADSSSSTDRTYSPTPPWDCLSDAEKKMNKYAVTMMYPAAKKFLEITKSLESRSFKASIRKSAVKLTVKELVKSFKPKLFNACDSQNMNIKRRKTKTPLLDSVVRFDEMLSSVAADSSTSNIMLTLKNFYAMENPSSNAKTAAIVKEVLKDQKLMDIMFSDSDDYEYEDWMDEDESSDDDEGEEFNDPDELEEDDDWLYEDEDIEFDESMNDLASIQKELMNLKKEDDTDVPMMDDDDDEVERSDSMEALSFEENIEPDQFTDDDEAPVQPGELNVIEENAPIDSEEVFQGESSDAFSYFDDSAETYSESSLTEEGSSLSTTDDSRDSISEHVEIVSLTGSEGSTPTNSDESSLTETDVSSVTGSEDSSCSDSEESTIAEYAEFLTTQELAESDDSDTAFREMVFSDGNEADDEGAEDSDEIDYEDYDEEEYEDDEEGEYFSPNEDEDEDVGFPVLLANIKQEINEEEPMEEDVMELESRPIEESVMESESRPMEMNVEEEMLMEKHIEEPSLMEGSADEPMAVDEEELIEDIDRQAHFNEKALLDDDALFDEEYVPADEERLFEEGEAISPEEYTDESMAFEESEEEDSEYEDDEDEDDEVEDDEDEDGEYDYSDKIKFSFNEIQKRFKKSNRAERNKLIGRALAEEAATFKFSKLSEMFTDVFELSVVLETVKSSPEQHLSSSSSPSSSEGSTASSFAEEHAASSSPVAEASLSPTLVEESLSPGALFDDSSLSPLLVEESLSPAASVEGAEIEETLIEEIETNIASDSTLKPASELSISPEPSTSHERLTFTELSMTTERPESSHSAEPSVSKEPTTLTEPSMATELSVPFNPSIAAEATLSTESSTLIDPSMPINPSVLPESLRPTESSVPMELSAPTELSTASESTAPSESLTENEEPQPSTSAGYRDVTLNEFKAILEKNKPKINLALFPEGEQNPEPTAMDFTVSTNPHKEFWPYIKSLFDRHQCGLLPTSDYFALLLKIFAVRALDRKNRGAVLARTTFPVPHPLSNYGTDNEKFVPFPRKEFLEKFRETYADDPLIRNELANLHLWPQINRLQNKRFGKLKDVRIYKGDILRTFGRNPEVPIFAMAENFYLDVNSVCYVSVIWLRPVIPNPETNFGFQSWAYEHGFYDEKTHRLDSFAFECSRPQAAQYAGAQGMAQSLKRRYRRILATRIKYDTLRRQKDLHASRIEDIIMRRGRRPNPLWIERREAFTRNKNGFEVTRQVIRAGKQSRDRMRYR